MTALVLDRLDGTFAIARLAPGEGWPHWMSWSRTLSAVVRTAAETSIVCDDGVVPSDVRAERGFAAYSVRGPLDFSAVGILSRLAAPLADADIPLLAFSTFDTDVILVRATRCPAAEQAWRAAGIVVDGE